MLKPVKRILFLLCIVSTLLTLVACSTERKFEYDQITVPLTKSNVTEYIQFLTTEEEYQAPYAMNSFTYEISATPKPHFFWENEAKLDDISYYNCKITLRITVNEKTRDVELTLDENGNSETVDVNFSDLKDAYVFNTSYSIISASGNIRDGMNNSFTEKGFFGDTHYKGYVTWFGEHRGAALEGDLDGEWTLEYVNPRKVFYISDCVYTKSGYPVLYEGRGLFSSMPPRKTVEVIIFDGEYNIDKTCFADEGNDYPTTTPGGYIILPHENILNLKDSFPNLHTVYIRNVVNDANVDSDMIINLPESGVTFYVDANATNLRKLLENTSFVNGIYSPDDFDITPYK